MQWILFLRKIMILTLWVPGFFCKNRYFFNKYSNTIFIFLRREHISVSKRTITCSSSVDKSNWELFRIFWICCSNYCETHQIVRYILDDYYLKKDVFSSFLFLSLVIPTMGIYKLQFWNEKNSLEFIEEIELTRSLYKYRNISDSIRETSTWLV